MDLAILTDEELLRYCVGMAAPTPLEVELLLRLERAVDTAVERTSDLESAEALYDAGMADKEEEISRLMEETYRLDERLAECRMELVEVHR